jgi:hypothetical protein
VKHPSRTCCDNALAGVALACTVLKPPSSHSHASSTPPPSPLLSFPKFCITILYSITYLHVVALVLCLIIIFASTTH